MKKRILFLFMSFIFIFTTCFVNYSWASEADDTSKVVFGDENIKKEVVNCLKDPNNLFDTSKAIDKTLATSYEPTVGDMKNLKKLTVGPLFDSSYNPISAKSIKGLEEAVNVVDLHLSSLHAPDINLISSLTNVEKLYLKSNDLNDLSIISNMHNLVDLNISSNNITNFSGIENSIKIEKLTATENKISDLSAIKNLTGLKELYLDNNKISEISPIENLKNLVVLRLSGNVIKSIDKIGSKPQLKELQINGTYTGPFDPPDQSGNVISDISKLSMMTNLETLYIQDTVLVKDLSPLSNLTKLKTLILRGNSITDIKPLANLTNLSTLYLYKNHVKDISPLSNMVNMKEFNFAVNNVEDISVLKNMKNLSDVKGYLNNISEFDSLKTVNAEVINFTHNHLIDLSFLKETGKKGTQGFYVLDRQDKSMKAEIVSEKYQDNNIEFIIKNPVRLADGSVLPIDASQKLDQSLKDDFEIGDAVEINNKVVDLNNAANIKIVSEGENLKISIPKTSYKNGMKIDVPFSKFGTLVSDDMPFELYGTFSGVVHFTMPAESINPDKPKPDSNIERIPGKKPIQIATEISKKSYDKSNYAILVSKNNYTDAILASPLASIYNAPILVTEADRISSEAKNELHRLGVKNIIIVGGESSVSKNIYNGLEKDKYKLERIQGANRYSTSVAVYNKIKSINKFKAEIILTSGENFTDGILASSIAIKNQNPILLTSKEKLPWTVKFAIRGDIKNVIVIGGNSSVPNNQVKNNFRNKNIKRISGENRYSTSIEVAKYLYPSSKTFVVSSGEDFRDSLTSSCLYFKYASPIMFTKSKELPKIISDYVNSYRKIYVVGSENIISTNVIEKIRNLHKK
ncbi:cell wall-binding repeat-containing protein [Peptostreptococcus equinus]|uniref:Cell wall-binding repeat-containing protein n=1 Tax=Peptostreptococcus equinus TaxID=3003601 RepID=A0ABY7JMR5_9FIRM|nr:cell wall-binding repeat-containing protein [Peptostreptococcus sp. CBA3647]WAW14121.1 cell wall-binding repeat-containing protein [Peptostreptococcus sp. CBA3647]